MLNGQKFFSWSYQGILQYSDYVVIKLYATYYNKFQLRIATTNSILNNLIVLVYLYSIKIKVAVASKKNVAKNLRVQYIYIIYSMFLNKSYVLSNTSMCVLTMIVDLKQ